MRSDRLRFPPPSSTFGRSETGVLLGNGEGWGCLLVAGGDRSTTSCSQGWRISGKHRAGTTDLRLSSAEEEWESRWRKPMDPAWEVSLRQEQVLGNGGNTTVEDPGTVSIRATNKSLTAHLLG